MKYDDRNQDLIRHRYSVKAECLFCLEQADVPLSDP